MRKVFNQSNMLKYYQEEFEPVIKKYGSCLDCIREEKRDKAYRRFYEYEDNRQFSELTKKEFGDIRDNLKLVYENDKLTEEIIEIYDLVYDKVISQYINIDGIERLFSENYINFEWEMHLGIDYEGHSMNFYRDHFIHQVRDAYMMDILLQEGFENKIKAILGNVGNSKISRYVCKYVNQQMEKTDMVAEELSGTAEDRETVEANRRDFYFHNIIYMSSYMSALFHDIGYPEVANMQSGRNILAYIANVYNFGSGYIDFDKIITVLQNSLLFRVVSPKEIRARVEGKKIDHGAVSALMFLLHFYENGAIGGLEPYKKCAVELAGLAIYNHTNKYLYLQGRDERKKRNTQYERNVFTLSPISYLLRICDDLQEWERIYFEISSKANMIICDKCRTPIVRKKKVDGDVYYLCNCNCSEEEKRADTGVFETVFNRGSFPYRRLYNVTVCKELFFDILEEKNIYVFTLNYDLGRLLNVAYINPSYAKYRIQELNQLKKMFVRQDMKEMIYLKYFMTANIILIKTQIVKQYLENVVKLSVKENVADISMYAGNVSGLHQFLKEKADFVYKESIRNEIIEMNIGDDIIGYFDNHFPLYIYFSMIIKGCMVANRAEIKDEKICDAVLELWKCFDNNLRYDEDALFLIKDCCEQAVRMYDAVEDYVYYPNKYFEQFKLDGDAEACFARFGHSDNYVPVRQVKVAGKLDAYTDLYCFKIMLKRLKQVSEVVE